MKDCREKAARVRDDALLRGVCNLCGCCIAASVWLGMLAGAETGREIFRWLSTPSDRVPVEGATPTPMAQLPTEAEMKLELRNAGGYVQEFAQLSGLKLSAECAHGLACVGSATLVLGRGSSLPVVEYGLQVRALRRWEAAWTAKARPELVPAIRRAFRKQEQVCKEDLLHAMESFRVAPIYLAFSAKQGQEKGFAAAYGRLAELLRQMSEREAGVQFVECGNFRGIRMSQRRAWEYFTGRELRDPDVCRVLDRREVCLLTAWQRGTASMILCEHPSDRTPPEVPCEDVPRPAASNAPTHELLASFYASTELCRAWQTSLRLRRLNLAQACVNALREACMDGPQHTAVYDAAQEALCEMVDCFGPTPLSKTPLRIRVWQTDGGVLAEGEADALQTRFAPGTLRWTEQADAPGSFFYLESTACTCPATEVDRSRIGERLPAVYHGVVQTLKPEARRRPEKYAAYVRMFGEELGGIGDAVVTMLNGIQAPLAVVATRAENMGAPPAWALCAGVKNRAALTEGWQRMLGCAGHAVEKLGVPSVVLDVLPTEHEKVATGADVYSIGLPLLAGMGLPSVAIDDRGVVLGNEKALNARLIVSSAGELPYCGAVGHVHLPTLAAILKSRYHLRPRVAHCIALLSQHFEHLYAVAGTNNGTLSVRVLLTEGVH